MVTIHPRDGMKTLGTALTTASTTPADSPGAFTLAHLSDPHLTSLVGVHPGDLTNKRILGYLSWRRRRRRVHRVETLAAVVADMRAFAPDHVAVTGDLTHVGLPEECATAAAWLRDLGPADRVSLVPGNHDRYVAADFDRTVGLWRDYFRGDDGAIGFPVRSPPRAGRVDRCRHRGADRAVPGVGSYRRRTARAPRTHSRTDSRGRTVSCRAAASLAAAGRSFAAQTAQRCGEADADADDAGCGTRDPRTRPRRTDRSSARSGTARCWSSRCRLRRTTSRVARGGIGIGFPAKRALGGSTSRRGAVRSTDT